MDRWVCNRCYASNDASAANCAKCGLLRGSMAPAESPTVGTSSSPIAPRRANLLSSILRRFWLVILVVGVGAGGAIFAAHRDSTGKITQGGSLAISDLALGDCFDRKDPNADQAEEVNARRCEEKHQFELMAIATMPAGDYPTKSQMEDFMANRCLPAFAAYVGRAYEASHLDIYWFAPVEGGWGNGDRLIQCAVYDPLNSQISGSLRGADR